MKYMVICQTLLIHYYFTVLGRMEGMLTSGCKTGVEFATAWNTLRHEGPPMSVTNIHGDSSQIRHDMVKTVLNRFCLTSKLRAEFEGFGLSKDLLPQEALEQEEDLQ